MAVMTASVKGSLLGSRRSRKCPNTLEPYAAATRTSRQLSVIGTGSIAIPGSHGLGGPVLGNQHVHEIRLESRDVGDHPGKADALFRGE